MSQGFWICKEDYLHVFRSIPNQNRVCTLHNKFKNKICHGELFFYIPAWKDGKNHQIHAEKEHNFIMGIE